MIGVTFLAFFVGSERLVTCFSSFASGSLTGNFGGYPNSLISLFSLSEQAYYN